MAAGDVPRVLRLFERLPRWATLAFCACLIGALGVVDYVSGAAIVLSVFYVMPVALAAWVAGRAVGTVYAAAASAAWFLADHYSLTLGWWSWIAWWNGAVRFSFFALIVLVVAALQHALLEERELARLDPLTGVANPRAFRDALELEIVRAERHGWPLTVAYVDVDDFKRVNDRFGHAVGDEVLAAIAAELGAAVRRTDAVARLGGDEFAVVLPEADAAVGATIFERVVRAVRDTVTRRGWSVTLSVGTVTCLEISECSPDRSGERLVTLADEAMYSAKQAGKNTMRQRVIGVLAVDGA
jgi:diguanylate cyclase (GGDEF)-like protein